MLAERAPTTRGGLGGDAVEHGSSGPPRGDQPADGEHGGELGGGLERHGRHASIPPPG